MKAKELKQLVASGAVDQWTMERINKIPLTNRQNASLYVEVEGVGRVETYQPKLASPFSQYKMTLHFAGLSCPLDGAMWEAALTANMYRAGAQAERDVEAQEQAGTGTLPKGWSMDDDGTVRNATGDVAHE